MNLSAGDVLSCIAYVIRKVKKEEVISIHRHPSDILTNYSKNHA